MTTSFARRRASTGSVAWAVVAWTLALGTCSVGFVRADLTTETHNGVIVDGNPHDPITATFTAIPIPFDEEHDILDNTGAGEGGGPTSQAVTSYLFDNVNGAFQFFVGFNDTLSEKVGSFAKSNGSILFSVDAETDFTFTGEFSVEVPEGYDYDITLEIDLFEDGKPMFTLEDPFDFEKKGVLKDSAVYELFYKYEIVVGTAPEFGEPGGASGFFTLDLPDAGSVTIVPVPGAALLGMIGLSLVAWRTRRSRP